MAAGTPLTTEQKERLIALDAMGLSASKIAAQLLEEFGIVKTRNAVIGVLNRSGARARRPSRDPAVARWGGKLKRRLVELDATGMTARAIAAHMSAEFGIDLSRNDVSGALKRFGVTASRPARGLVRKSLPDKAGAGEQSFAVPHRRPLPPPPPRPVFEGPGVPFLAAESHHCRRVVGHGADGLAVFCGAQVITGKSWCPSCHVRIFACEAA